MTKVELMNGVTRTVNRIGFSLKKHSPEILLVTGVVGVVGSAVLACKATLKVNETLAEPKNTVERIHTAVEKGENEAGEVYTEEDGKKDLALVYAKTGIEFVKLYGPSVALGAFSIGCILASNNIIHKRNVALAAAYATVDNGFKEYRGRVIERFGEELDRELKYNLKTKEVEEVVVNEDGTESVVTKTVQTAEINSQSDFSFFFCEGCKGWTKSPEINKAYVLDVQNWANDRLRTKGHLFLNEIYEMFGIPQTAAGHHVGWVYDSKNPEFHNYIDFNVYDIDDERKRAFVNGWERSILIDPNVDGDVYKKIF